ncbi:PadR family transcriptional regulator [Chitinasiproducens palmae]|uniref:DNA-binding transcriptional regulator, PadR family n=1 Tax=Chitinasiproducens palmae TaxID=1770053 RepID=A0A1H2PJB0_9BURK|nr:PadR family transcriptional regulator [Chitinasiproducens palmae]SDV46460.1 DNA-binding transcriptional regulator, PadR family [Chitinasiproducens palmae]
MRHHWFQHEHMRQRMLHRMGGRGDIGGRGRFATDEEPLVRGRRFSSDDLQLLLLAELGLQPSHGYELIKAIDARARGCYRPSPGVLYPALAFLEDTGLVEARVDQNRKSYSLTDAGRKHLAAEAESIALLHARLAHLARRMERMQRALSAAEGNGDDAPPSDGWLDEYVDARRALKRALLLRDGAGHEEQRRIAALLRETVKRIEASDPRTNPRTNPPSDE